MCAVALGFQGKATIYHFGENGACGKVITADEMGMAISARLYGDYPNSNKSPVCGKCALVKAVDKTGQSTGKQVKVKMVERCEGCVLGAIQLSSAAFRKLTNDDLHLDQVIWNYVKC
ncbi:papain inhibitor-like [Paramacrobiotus metropolitanus]|uniref:papain inhibitor-like n=1 Tax=Paramacrobiotus metropolitanus TaxID=2943436 RepID=UPI00244616CA|nr:papain inhibitor-like [Paramacrobiotus metropolitanus]